MTLAQKITYIRENAKMNKVQFAQRLCVSVSYISQLESGRPYHLSDAIIRLLETEFKVNVEWFKYDIGEPYAIVASDENETKILRLVRQFNKTQRALLLNYMEVLQHVSAPTQDEKGMVDDRLLSPGKEERFHHGKG